MKKRRIVVLLLAAVIARPLCPQSSLPLTGVGGGGGAPAAVPFIKSCNGSTFGSATQDCVFASSVASTSVIYVVAQAIFLTTVGVSGCGATWTTNTLQANGATVLEAWGIPSAGACTVTLTAGISGTLTISAGEYGPSVGGVDNMVNLVHQGFVGSGSPINCPAITTGGSNEQVVCGMEDSGGSGGTSTAGPGFAIDAQGTNFGWLIESQGKAVAGSVTPTATSSAGTQIVSGSIAIKP